MNATDELEIEAESADAELAGLDAAGRIAWAQEQFGQSLLMSTSFGAQSAVLLDLVRKHAPSTPVVFVDTGYLFPETYQFAEALMERLDLRVEVYSARRSPAWQESIEGRRWEQGKEALAAYNFENKVEPMNRAVREFGARAWISGLRRSQAKSRANLGYIQKQQKVYKLHPIADWSDRDIYNYLSENDLPYHPLWEKGYVSIGDWHSSSPLQPGMEAEDTRFGGIKRECGLHEASGQIDFQI
ncbi:MAG: phosphoadenylyl-sulfate reductase [Verrucomicrobiota bacterium]